MFIWIDALKLLFPAAIQYRAALHVSVGHWWRLVNAVGLRRNVWCGRRITSNCKNSVPASIQCKGHAFFYSRHSELTKTEMDALRRSARISKLDIKKNEYIRGRSEIATHLVTRHNTLIHNILSTAPQ
jgi:hypothetical protein